MEWSNSLLYIHTKGCNLDVRTWSWYLVHTGSQGTELVFVCNCVHICISIFGIYVLGPGSCANMKLVVKEPRGSRHLEHNGCQEAEVYSGHSHSSSSGTNTYCLIGKYKIVTQRNTKLSAKQMQKTSFRRQRSTHATTTCHLLATNAILLNGQIQISWTYEYRIQKQ